VDSTEKKLGCAVGESYLLGMRNHLKYCLLCVLVFGCAFQAHAFLGKALKKDAESEEGKSQVELPEYTGIKHAIAVTDFKNEQNWRAQIELGNALAAMLESALFESGRFVLVERGDLGDVIAEQDLQASGRAAESTDVALVRFHRNLKGVLNVERKAGSQLQHTIVVRIVSATPKRCALCCSSFVRPSKKGFSRDTKGCFEASRRSGRLREEQEVQLRRCANKGHEIGGRNAVRIVQHHGRRETVLGEVAADRDEDLRPARAGQEDFPKLSAAPSEHPRRKFTRDCACQRRAGHVRNVVIGEPITRVERRLGNPGGLACP